MASRLFVGNLSYNTNDESLKAAFSEYGTVRQAKVVTDRETGRSRGFGFVEFDDEGSGAIAIQAMNGANLEGRNLVVNVAHERENRGGGGGGRPREGGGGFGGGGSGGGGGDRGGRRGGGRGGRGRDRGQRNEWD